MNPIKQWLKSAHYAGQGLLFLLKTERNFQIQTGVVVITTIMGIYFDITKTEWIFQFICMGIVTGAEAINTAVEKLCDHVTPEQHPQIKRIKDMAAGGVAVLTAFAFFIGILIYYPYIFN